MKKINIFKYIFFIIVILSIGIGIYTISKTSSTKAIEIKESKINNIGYTEITIGVVQLDNFNPILSKNKSIQYIAKLVYNSLLKINDKFEIEADLAKEYSKINSTTYLIKLKEDIYWHDNVNLTAEDVEFTINNLKDVDSIYKSNVSNIKEIQIIDEYTIKILLNEENSFFEYMLSFPILSKHGYEDGTLNNKTKMPIGTGKYKISKIEDKRIILEKRDIESDLKIKKININLYETNIELYNDFVKEKVDFINTNNINYENYIGKIGFYENICADREYDFLAINNSKGILSYKEIRQAINYSIDKNEIIYNVWNNKYVIANSPLDYGSFLNINSNYEFNLHKAKDVLINNGWEYKDNIWKNKKTKEQISLNLAVEQENEKRVQVAEIIKQQLEKLGIKINLYKISNTEYKNYIKNKNYDLLLTGNIVSINPNLDTYFSINNLFNYNNEEIHIVLSRMKQIEDKSLIKEEYKKIMEIYNDKIPFISLYFNSNIIIYNSKLRGDMKHNWYDLFYNIDNWYKE